MARPAGARAQPVEYRPNGRTTEKSADYTSEGVDDNDVFLLPVSDYQVMIGVTILGAIIRLFRIYQPDSVVFDEVQYVLFNPSAPSYPKANSVFLQFRWLRFEIHQGQILYGCPPSLGQAPHHAFRLACRL